MKSHVFIVDAVTHRGDFRKLVNNVVHHVSTKFPGARAVWTIRPDQATLADGLEVIHTSSFAGESCGSPIAKWIVEASRNGHADSVFHVLSYDGHVLGAASRLNAESLIVDASHFGSLKPDEVTVPRPTMLIPEHFDAKVPSLGLEEALDIAKRVLRDGGYTSNDTALLQSRLRTLMSRVDSRARKNLFDTNSVSLITRVIQRGLASGWLQQTCESGKSGSERIWYVEQSPSLACPTSAPLSLSATISAPLKSANEETLSESTRSSQESSPLSEPNAPKSRADRMEAVLREQRIGSPVIPRRYLFDGVEQVLKDSNGVGLTTSELVSKSQAFAEERAKANGYDRPQKWDLISQCFLRMLLEADVLMTSDGQPVPRGIGVYSAKVTSVCPDFRILAEALLVERIIKKLGDVRMDDILSLGLAIYRQGATQRVGAEELRERVDRLLVKLKDQQRLDLNADGCLIAVKPGTIPL